MREKRFVRARGFTMIEILIVVVILGILAAIVVPQFSNASTLARENTLKDELRYLRTQITVYAAQHGDRAPGVDGDLDVQLTTMTEADGSAGTKFGPYLSRMPANPLNGKSSVTYVTGAMTADGASGWIYSPATREIKANLVGADTGGMAYGCY